MTSTTTVTAGLLLAVAFAPAIAAEPPAMPPQAAVCTSCHGAQGQGIVPTGPRLAGLSASYMEKQIKDFQAGTRQNAIMAPMSMMLQGDAAISTVTGFFAAQPIAPLSPILQGEQQGFEDPAQQLAYMGDWSRNLPACVSCHGPSGVGGGDFPRLAGQQANYLKDQLIAWQKGTRKGDVDNMMGNVANKLTAEEVELMANYFANLK
ncbi:c-type cytochrome [Shewanella sp. GXUN23E]|uniref:c-type cytochrome n=1 Tax=Shewanella sp. GXUN23E TaxID=3422498 RepID=UPI003D7D8CCA